MNHGCFLSRSSRLIAALLVVTVAAPAAAAPGGPPTLADLNRFTGTWSCSFGPVATSSFRMTARLAPSAFTMQTPTTITTITSRANVLTAHRANTTGAVENYRLASYKANKTAIVFQSTDRSLRAGFEMSRESGYLTVTRTSSNAGVDQTCSRV